jgi:tetratricopeptide (TPR) repeat protein
MKVVITLVLFFVSCAHDDDLESVGKNLGDRTTIVRQAEVDDSILSSKPRSYWVEQREGAKDQRAKALFTLATGEWKVAESDARLALVQFPQDPKALIALSLALAMQKRYALADYYAKIYVKFHGNEIPELQNVRALARLSVPKSRMSDFRWAQEQFEVAFNQSQREIAAGLNLGHLLLELGDASSAVDIFKEIGQRCSGCIASQLGLGIAAGRIKDYGTAKSAFQKVLDQQRYHPQALYRMAMITYQGDKDIEKAKSYIDLINTYAPNDAVMIRQRAEALVRAMDAEKKPSQEMNP